MQAGHSTKSIARSMRISPHTIKVHRRNIYEKLGVSTQAEVFALLSGRMAR
ncbi:response regulator transcription factor [Komagataeibacter swingsii]|nr:LuxR C-terminal-related transcriptional regulator [Komagataeibacter swingsii]